MIVEWVQVDSKEKEKAIIYATEKTDDIMGAMELLEGSKGSICARRDGENVVCKTGAIYYLESVDKKTFLYTREACLETKYRLYELEELLPPEFLRCSKAMIVNIKKIRSVKSEISGRMNAVLLNGEEIVISRSYVKELKRRLEIK